jgi:hypothetical protein
MLRTSSEFMPTGRQICPSTQVEQREAWSVSAIRVSTGAREIREGLNRIIVVLPTHIIAATLLPSDVSDRRI